MGKIKIIAMNNISFIINPNYQILLFTFIVSYSIFFITYLSLAINKNYTTVNNIIKPILQINGYRLKLINRINIRAEASSMGLYI